MVPLPRGEALAPTRAAERVVRPPLARTLQESRPAHTALCGGESPPQAIDWGGCVGGRDAPLGWEEEQEGCWFVVAPPRLFVERHRGNKLPARGVLGEEALRTAFLLNC